MCVCAWSVTTFEEELKIFLLVYCTTLTTTLSYSVFLSFNAPMSSNFCNNRLNEKSIWLNFYRYPSTRRTVLFCSMIFNISLFDFSIFLITWNVIFFFFCKKRKIKNIIKYIFPFYKKPQKYNTRFLLVQNSIPK